MATLIHITTFETVMETHLALFSFEIKYIYKLTVVFI